MIMGDAAQGAIEFGVFLVLVLAVFWAGLDRGPDADDIEMGSGHRPADEGTGSVDRRVAA